MFFVFFFQTVTSKLFCSNSRRRARRGKLIPRHPPPTISSVNRLPFLPRPGRAETAAAHQSSPKEKHHSQTLSINLEESWRWEGQEHRSARSSYVGVHASSERCCLRNTWHMPGLFTNLLMQKLSVSTTTMKSSSTPWISAPSR